MLLDISAKQETGEQLGGVQVSDRETLLQGGTMYWDEACRKRLRRRKLKLYFDGRSNNWRRLHKLPLIRLPLQVRRSR